MSTETKHFAIAGSVIGILAFAVWASLTLSTLAFLGVVGSSVAFYILLVGISTPSPEEAPENASDTGKMFMEYRDGGAL